MALVLYESVDELPSWKSQVSADDDDDDDDDGAGVAEPRRAADADEKRSQDSMLDN